MPRVLLQTLTFLFSLIAVQALSLKDRFDHAQIGDFVVTEQDKNYCLLFIRHLDADILVIDEMTFHEQNLPKNFKGWQKAEFGNAYPLSWISFQFDRKTGILEEAYNFNEKSWLEFQEQEVFLKGLLNLDLSYVKDSDRKKIGATPRDQEPDLRKCWCPPLIIQGIRYHKPLYEVYKGRWAEDMSLLSRCHIEMYFSKHDSSLPFPTWIEINNGHYGFKLKGVDAGHNFALEYIRPLPKKPLLLASGFEYKKDLLLIKIKAPRSSRDFDLCAECPKTKVKIPLKYSLSSCGEKDLFFLTVSLKELHTQLEKSKSYHLIFYPDKNPDFFIRTQDLFICP
jgi:hypothetical protein